MTFQSRLSSGFVRLLNQAGNQIKVEYFDTVFDDVYDEEVNTNGFVLSGTLWTSGIVLPVNTRRGSEDAVLLEQGKLQEKDKKLYVNGSLDFVGIDQVVKVTLGSPTGDVFSTIPLGGIKYDALGIDVYKRQYLRLLPTGSF